MNDLAIEYRPIEGLIPYARNARLSLLSKPVALVTQ